MQAFLRLRYPLVALLFSCSAMAQSGGWLPEAEAANPRNKPAPSAVSTRDEPSGDLWIEEPTTSAEVQPGETAPSQPGPTQVASGLESPEPPQKQSYQGPIIAYSLRPTVDGPNDDEATIEPGYNREPNKAHNALILAGSITGATAYGLSLVAASFGTPELFVPILGPWIALHKMSSNCDSGSSDGACWNAQQLDVMDGVLQIAGAGLILAGLLVPKYKLVPQIDESINVRLVPLNLGKQGSGIGVVGQF